MIDNSAFLNSSLDSLLLQSSLSSLNSLNKLKNIKNISNSRLSYSQILEAMKKKVDDDKTLEELSTLEKKYEEAMAPIQMFDFFHDIYINNGLFGRATKTKLRNMKYNAWNNIFSLQAERINAETQIALKSALSQTAQKLK